jgi:cystathionine beta-lyase/cystathionine gamma-synthase
MMIVLVVVGENIRNAMAEDNKKLNFNTRAIHVAQEPEPVYGAVSHPIYLTSTYKQESFGEYIYDYSRAGNPTRDNLEKSIASLEDGKGAVAFGSGMAAISSIITLLSSGDHIIVSHNVYGGTFRIIDKIYKNFNIEVDWVNTSDIEAIKNGIKTNTKFIFIETPTNPMMQLSDIESIANIAHENNLKLIVDNTFMSPYFQRPLNFGADMVLHSTTKYLNGHSDVVGGIVISNDLDILDKLTFIQMSVGAVPSPFDCWLTQRSLKTLAIRMERHNSNAQKIAQVLEDSKKFEKVYYPGLKSHPQHNLAKKQQLDPNGEPGFGGMISVVLQDQKSAQKFVNKLKLFILAESLGGVESLVCHPASMTHASIPLEKQKLIGLTDGLVRLSVGIEDPKDLLIDINNALGF